MPKSYTTTDDGQSKNHHSTMSVATNTGSRCITNKKNFETILLLERSLERNGQQWVENINVIEQFLVDIVETIGQLQPKLKSNFILRRLPMYTATFTNKNEYAVVLKNFDYTLLSPNNRRHSTLERKGMPNFGQIEIFCKNKGPIMNTTEKCAAGREKRSNKPDENMWTEVVNDNNAFCSHEIFKKFASTFIRAANFNHEDELSENNNPENVEEPVSSCSSASSSQNVERKEKVQLISPHLLHDLMKNVEVTKIFTLVPTTRIQDKKNGKYKTAQCRISINYLKSLITISLEDTEVTVKPCLFCDQGYTKVNSNLLDRIPLFHTNILSICDALGKGCLLFPTSFETFWTLQFWPCESHLICVHHPSSLLARIFKLYSTFCLNPQHFWETLNNCFLIGVEDMTDSLSEKNNVHDLTLDFLISTFLFEMEKFSTIEDWAPRNFYNRFINLIRSSVDCHEKAFHAHYFTKMNILRGVWKDCIDTPNHFEKEESCALKELDDIEEFPEDTTERTADYLDNDDEEDYGLHFDTLETRDEDLFSHFSPTPITSDMVYKSVNPFQSMDNLTESDSTTQRIVTPKQRRAKTLSKMFGSNLINRLTWSLGKGQGIENQNKTKSNACASSSKSMADVTLGFEESVAHTRREQSLHGHLTPPSVPLSTISRLQGDDDETSFSHRSSSQHSKSVNSSYSRGRSQSVPTAVTTINNAKSKEDDLHFENDNANASIVRLTSQGDSIYSNILQILLDTPPSDHLSDSEVIQDLEKSKKVLESQDELVGEWSFIMSEIATPKVVCPHTFSPRQVQYLAHVIKKTSRCSPSAIKLTHSDQGTKSVPIPAWEISGDLLRIVLHQMRSEPALHDSFKEKQKPVKRLSLKGLKSATTNNSENGDGHSSRSKVSLLKQKLSFKKKHSDVCTGHLRPSPGTGEYDAGETQFALEEPEVAATNRLLQWLWQLKSSDIGRLSFKAKRYMEFLHRTSFNNSHFIEQFTEENVFQSMAIRSAVAVSRIMTDEKFPAYVPLLAASKKGWLWAEMILSLASWNQEKGFPILAHVPLSSFKDTDEVEGKAKTLLRDIYLSGASIGSTLKKVKSSDTDADAVTLAFHSELASPLGWNDFEDPRRPGPFTVPILIFSSLGYFKKWEMVPGNVVQVMVRLQKFNNLQHVGSLLFHPHRKTALNEVRKLNKSLSSRTFQFDDNVMSKTFKRLASLRSTRKLFSGIYSVQNRPPTIPKTIHICKEFGCALDSNGEFECTRL